MAFDEENLSGTGESKEPFIEESEDRYLLTIKDIREFFGTSSNPKNPYDAMLILLDSEPEELVSGRWTRLFEEAYRRIVAVTSDKIKAGLARSSGGNREDYYFKRVREPINGGNAQHDLDDEEDPTDEDLEILEEDGPSQLEVSLLALKESLDLSRDFNTVNSVSEPILTLIQQEGIEEEIEKCREFLKTIDEDKVNFHSKRQEYARRAYLNIQD